MASLLDGSARSRGVGKSASAYRTISEVSDELSVPQHVLRFWESKFSQVRPLKRGGGRRYYRPEDIGLLRQIQKLLYEDGYTIKGVQRLLREGRGQAPVPKPASNPPERRVPAAIPMADPVTGGGDGLPEPLRAELKSLLTELRQLRAVLASEGVASEG